MTVAIGKTRILLIRPWTAPLTAFRQALRDAGIVARISRVDIEPALNAAIERGTFDVIVHDLATPGIPRDIVHVRLREHRRDIPIVDFDDATDTVGRIMVVLARRLN